MLSPNCSGSNTFQSGIPDWRKQNWLKTFAVQMTVLLFFLKSEVMNDTFVLPGCHRNTSETVTQQWHCWLCYLSSSAMPETCTNLCPRDPGMSSRQHLPILHSQVSLAGSALICSGANGQTYIWRTRSNRYPVPTTLLFQGNCLKTSLSD